MIDEPNGNNVLNVKLTSNSSVIPITSSQSTDDLSQSLSASEYTDADESMSAPTEFLAEVIIDFHTRTHMHNHTSSKICKKQNAMIKQ